MQNPQTKPIEQWTRQECEEYLAQYPKSLRSEAVRKRLCLLTLQPSETKPDEAENTQTTTDVNVSAAKIKEDERCGYKKPASNPIDEPQPLGNSRQNAAGKGRDVPGIVGSVVLSILAIALCYGVYFLVTEVIGWEQPLLAGAIGTGILFPLWKEIWS